MRKPPNKKRINCRYFASDLVDLHTGKLIEIERLSVFLMYPKLC